jgi:hypothetical protein
MSCSHFPSVVNTVYGLEQSDGFQALVMELVEGPTLADRIAQGPIPVDEALPIAKQIAEALEAAHEQGIGRRAFEGEDMTEVLGAVVRLEPNWEALPSNVPPSVPTLLQSCLVKDRRRRVADISTALFVLEKAARLAAPLGTASVAPLPRRPQWQRVVTPVAAALVASTVGGTAVWFGTRPIRDQAEGSIRNSAPSSSSVRR